ncbi:hypothetical protein HDE80_002924 [Rhodanobacter sp. A1T4]|jgi:hypothetical protein|nr:hypothetical protein [Rhodanobacter sp. A1T4]
MLENDETYDANAWLKHLNGAPPGKRAMKVATVV